MNRVLKPLTPPSEEQAMADVIDLDLSSRGAAGIPGPSAGASGDRGGICAG
jgi:hypothetical protein